MLRIFYLLNALNFYLISCNKYNVPDSHVPYYLYNLREDKTQCLSDETCAFHDAVKKNVCWGYEENCSSDQSFSSMECPGHHKGWVQTKIAQVETFYNQADFGYVGSKKSTLKKMCGKVNKEHVSRLDCTENLEFCKGKNIMIDFTDLLNKKEPIRYSMDVLKDGQISGKCKVNKNLLKKNLLYISPLQSWAPEMRFFKETEDNFSESCDLWVTKPTIITKIDASVSMYHHFCDFFNIYASQHLNFTTMDAFQTDNQVLIWETYPYNSNFGVTWKAFTQNPIWTLEKVKGKKVCFKDVMFPLLPRMIFGLFYNTPIIWGCEKSGLFKAFSEHILHRLKIEQAPRDQKIHITLLSRRTQFRKILNEEALVDKLRRIKNIEIRTVEFTHADSFLDQLKQDQWTDILIGMHGSGLTHLLFLPDWAVVFEVYNCGDPDCYKDLARLRGLKYLTWEKEDKIKHIQEGKHPDGRRHLKFANYDFDEDEFVRLVTHATDLVRKHPQWQLVSRHRNKDEL